MRALAVADETSDVAHGDRLAGEQLGGGGEAARAQVLFEGEVPKLGIGALELARGARERVGDGRERERAAVVAGDEQPGEHVEAAALADCVGAHIPYSDSTRAGGQTHCTGSVPHTLPRVRQPAYRRATRSAAPR